MSENTTTEAESKGAEDGFPIPSPEQIREAIKDVIDPEIAALLDDNRPTFDYEG